MADTAKLWINREGGGPKFELTPPSETQGNVRATEYFSSMGDVNAYCAQHGLKFRRMNF